LREKHAPVVDVLRHGAAPWNQYNERSKVPSGKEIPDLLTGALWDVMHPGSDLQEGIYNTELGIDAGTGDDSLLTYCGLSGTT
jgi:hypothetical protein